RSFRWKVRLIEDPNRVDAIALPGGTIAVYTGVLRLAGKEPRLAASLAHELIHALARHSAQRIRSELARSLALAAAGTGISEGGLSPEALSDLAVAMGFAGKNGVILPFNHDHENEADRAGLLLMARAGY